MERAKLRVELLDYTEAPLSLLWKAYRQCYAKAFVVDMKEPPEQEKERFVRRMVKRGHLSPLEHVKFTFAIEGISRACSHQLVRHRIASYSQQSQRYVDMRDMRYVVPPSIAEDPFALNRYEEAMRKAREAYEEIVLYLLQKGYPPERAKEDARFLLPEATETKIVLTMNVRELLHFFSQRCCSRAQWEIRELAWRMLEVCKEKLPSVFSEAGPKCDLLGYCPEGEEGCGRRPPFDKVFGR